MSLPFTVYTALAVITSGRRSFPTWWSDPLNPHPELHEDELDDSEPLLEPPPENGELQLETDVDPSLDGVEEEVSESDESLATQSEPSTDDS